MTNPTRQEIIDAHNALEELSKRSLGTRYVEMAILKALPPKPKLTMGDIEWDDDEHYMAEAEHHLHGLVTMIGPVGIRGNIQCTFRNDDGINTVYVSRDYLTPTGRNYRLQEAQDD